jgi:hypothetical protein
VNKAQNWSWREGSVDRRRDHLVLSHDAFKSPLAVVGPAVEGVFPVELTEVRSVSDPDLGKALEAARRELDFYLVELSEPDPWAYAIYHCRTMSNVYSSIHWSWHPANESP